MRDIVLVLLLTGAVAMSACAQEKFELRRNSHPRLEMTPAELAAARADQAQVAAARASGDAALARDRTGSYADYYIPLPQAPYPKPHSDQPEWPYWTGLCGSVGSYISALAKAYALTQDSKYLDACRTTTLSVCKDWPQWTDPDYGTQPCLDTYSLTKNVSIVYDLLYDALTEPERAAIREALATKGALFVYRYGQDPSSYVHSPTAWPNGYAVVNTALGVAALTLMGEDARAEQWLAQALAKARLYFDQQGGVDGGLVEGFGYGSFAVDNFTYLVETTDRVVGVSLFDHPYLKQAIYFPAYSILPDAPLLASIGDNGSANGCEATLIDTAHAAVAVRKDPLAAWYLTRVGQATPAEAAVAAVADDLPLARGFRDVRWAMLRSGWGKQDALMVFKCGFPNNHNHVDQNHFVLGYGSEWVINDPGYQIYDMDYPPERHMDRAAIKNMHVYTAGTEGHNSLLVDGRGQLEEPGEMRRFFSSHALAYAMGDATACYKDRLTRYWRHVIQLPGRYFLTWDEVEAAEPRELQMLLHTTSDGKFVVAGSELGQDAATDARAFVIQRSAAQVAVDLVAPQGLTTTARTWPDSATYGHFVSVSPGGRLQQADIVTLLRPGPVGDGAGVTAHATVQQGGGRYAVVELAGERDLILLDGGANPAGGVASDGEAALVGMRGSEIVRYALVKGAHLTTAGHALVQSKCAISVGALADGDTARIEVEAPEACEVRLLSPIEAKAITFAGGGEGAAAVAEAGRIIRLSLPAGRQTIYVGPR
jgi:hypothetical protein